MLRALTLPAEVDSMDVRAVHRSHADFVWARLQRLGVRPEDLEDLFQEVFVVVHRRLHTFDGRVPIDAWLVGICAKVAAAQRRRAHVRREQLVESVPEVPSREHDQDETVARHEQELHLRRALARLEPDKRIVFVMFELEEMSCQEIADALTLPVGTVHSRLFAARKLFQKALRWSAPAAAAGREEKQT
jgi:RNA polymerase sigma-70 factor (ECF subfamily)